MKLILLENIIILVKSETMLNKRWLWSKFSIEKGKALRDNKENKDYVNQKKDLLNKKNIEIKKKFMEMAKLVDKKKFTIYKESKENGELYGTIKPKEIAGIIKEQTKADVVPSQIVLKESLNKIGIYNININFHSEVDDNISIKISKNETK